MAGLSTASAASASGRGAFDAEAATQATSSREAWIAAMPPGMSASILSMGKPKCRTPSSASRARSRSNGQLKDDSALIETRGCNSPSTLIFSQIDICTRRRAWQLGLYLTSVWLGTSDMTEFFRDALCESLADVV